MGGSTYAIKYQLDSVGDELVIKMAEAEKNRIKNGGSREFNDQVTITGNVTNNDKNEFAVSKLCITPQDAGKTFCFGNDGKDGNDDKDKGMISSACDRKWWMMVVLTSCASLLW